MPTIAAICGPDCRGQVSDKVVPLASLYQLEARLIGQTAYLDETIDGMKKALHIPQARIVTYTRPSTFKSDIYAESPAEIWRLRSLSDID